VIRIIIGDDHPYIREGIKRIFEKERTFSIAGEASSAAELVDLLGRKACDILLLDLTLPDRSGLDLIGEIREINHPPRIIVLTIHAEEEYAIKCFRLGVDGYVTKDAAPEELVRAIRKVHAGGKYITGTIATRLADEIAQPTKPFPLDSLSKRERDVFIPLAAGKSLSSISEELGISVQAVSTYKTRIMLKMSFRSLRDIVKYAVDNDIGD
jgi:DNA-binding NarL/FixJ family response regulator